MWEEGHTARDYKHSTFQSQTDSMAVRFPLQSHCTPIAITIEGRKLNAFPEGSTGGTQYG